MPTNWTVLDVDNDFKSAYPVLFATNDEGDWDPGGVASEWLPVFVNQFRSAIFNGNRVALSLTAGSVPPEAVPYVLSLVAEKVVINAQRMVNLVLVEGGENGPLVRSINDARTFLKDCQAGRSIVTAPSDPDPNTLPSSTKWGDDSGQGSATTVISNLTVDAPPF
jgi:hypothetical protein